MSLYGKAAQLDFSSTSSRIRYDNRVEEEKAKEMERNNVERRRYWLTKLPKMYIPGHRQRYVFLNLDNTASALLMSNTLYQRVEGATSNRGLQLNFEALTKHLRGHETEAVKFQLATYCKTSSFVAHALEKFGWTLKPIVSDENGLYDELLGQLARGAAHANGKTLVLATGDGRLGTTNANAYREIVCKFLKQGWYVEIHAWLYALNSGYLRLQSENPGRVVVKPLDDVVSILAHQHDRQYPHSAPKPSDDHLAPPYAQPSLPSARTAPETQPRTSAFSALDNSAPYSAAIGERSRVIPTPPVTPAPTSWAEVVAQGHTPRSTTPTTENSSPDSTLFGSVATPQSLPPASLNWTSALPPLFTPPAPSPMRSGLMLSLQMQDLLSSQLVMRQTILRQTTELMRLMREQENRKQAPGDYRQGRGAQNPWANERGL